jgi:hypothetical protein
MGLFSSQFRVDHSCDEDDFHLRVLHDGRGYDHLVKYRVSRGMVSQDVWLEEIRTFGGQQTVRIVGVKTVPVVGLLSSTFAPTTYKADSAKEELDIFVNDAVKGGRTVVQTWSRIDRKVYFMVDRKVALVSCIVYHDDDLGFLKSVKMELHELDRFPCDEGFMKFLMDL